MSRLRDRTILKGIRDADALIPTLAEQIDTRIDGRCLQLRVIANYAVGYNNIDSMPRKQERIVVTNTPDILTESTADLTWALLLAAARRIPEGHGLVQQNAWTGWEPRQLLGADVYGRTLGIIGMGRIGQAVARRARGFDMPIVYHTRGERLPDQPSWKPVGLDDVLDSCRLSQFHVPLTEDTHHLIGARELTTHSSDGVPHQRFTWPRRG